MNDIGISVDVNCPVLVLQVLIQSTTQSFYLVCIILAFMAQLLSGLPLISLIEAFR